MSRGFVGGLALLAMIASSAFAADMPVKARPAIAGPNWEGFYLGAHAGYAFANDTYNIDPLLGGVLGISSTNIFGSRGFSGGVLGGYNLMVSPRWLAGVEADYSWQDIATNMELLSGLGSLTTTQKWAFSLRARFGYLVTPGTLVYGTAGWAWSRLEEQVALIGIPFSTAGNISGLQVGAGMETVIADNWRGRLEYLHTFYSAASLDPAGAAVDSIKPSVGLGRVALIYQFGASHASMPWPERAVAAPGWTGVYAAASIGGAFGYADVDIPIVATVKGVGLAGPIPSLFVGYNYQFAERWVIGAEAEIAPSIRSTDLKLGWLGAVRGRLGYLLMPDTMVYGTVGWLGTALDDIVINGVTLVQGQRINGMQIGGGIESALNEAWRVRLDYQYAIMQKLDITLPSAPPVAATVEPRGHVGRIAIVRRFTSN